jgi:hypothetical protein
MIVATRTDGLGWDVHVDTETISTVRSIIVNEDKTEFTVVNPYKIANHSLTFATFDEAVHAAENLLV